MTVYDSVTQDNLSELDCKIVQYQQHKCRLLIDALLSVIDTEIGEIAWEMLLSRGPRKGRIPLDEETRAAIEAALKRVPDGEYRDMVLFVWSHISWDEMRVLKELRTNIGCVP